MDLFQTIELNDLEMVKALLNAGHGPNTPDASGTTPLIKALGQPPIAELLIQAGANVNAPDTNGVPPLIQASMIENSALVHMLLKAGANINGQCADGTTALSVAISECNQTLAQILIQAGADVNLADHRGNTSLIQTAFNNQTPLAQILLQAGADLNGQDIWGYTALMWAAHEGCVEMVARFISAGADVRLRNHIGETALKHAHISEKPTAQPIIKMLRDAEDAQCWNKKIDQGEPPGAWTDGVTLTRDVDLLPSLEDLMLAEMEKELSDEPEDITDTLRKSDSSSQLMMDAPHPVQESASANTPDMSVEENQGEDLDALLEDLDDSDEDAHVDEAKEYIAKHQADVVVANLVHSNPLEWPPHRLISFCTSLSALAKANGTQSLSVFQKNAHPLLRDFVHILIQFSDTEMAVLDWHLSCLFNLPLRPISIWHQMILDFFAKATFKSSLAAASLQSYYKRVDFDKWMNGMYAPYLREKVDGNYTITGPGNSTVDPNTKNHIYPLSKASLDERVGALSSLSELAYRRGSLALEEHVQTYDDDMLQYGFKLDFDIESYKAFELFKAYITTYSIQNQIPQQMLKITALEIRVKHNPKAIECRLRALTERLIDVI